MPSLPISTSTIPENTAQKFKEYITTNDVNKCDGLDPNIGFWIAVFLNRSNDIKYFVGKGVDINYKFNKYICDVLLQIGYKTSDELINNIFQATMRDLDVSRKN
jgi:hypothetical protein